MVYFDNAATTIIDEDILNDMMEFSKKYYANIDSIHKFGIETYNIIKENMKILKNRFNLDENCFSFTSGGGEANNIAITSILNKYKKGHIITTVFEHPSVLRTLEEYSNDFDITYVNPKLDKLNFKMIEKELREDTVFITLTSCNSELGIIYDVNEISKEIKKIRPDIVVHTDFVQALNHSNMKFDYIDMFSISSHKINGPKGVGAIYIKKGIKIKTNLYGDNKNNGIMKRTMPTFLVYGFLKALEKEKNENILSIKNYAIFKLKEEFKDNIYIIENDNDAILSFSIKNLLSEILLNYLSSKDIYISVGAACSKGASKVAKEIGLPKEYEKGLVRLSFSKYNKINEIDLFMESIKNFRKILKI